MRCPPEPFLKGCFHILYVRNLYERPDAFLKAVSPVKLRVCVLDVLKAQPLGLGQVLRVFPERILRVLYL